MSSIYNNDINEENQIDKSTTIYPKLMNHQNRAVSSNVTRKKMSISISKLGKRKSFKIEAINLKKNREKDAFYTHFDRPANRNDDNCLSYYLSLMDRQQYSYRHETFILYGYLYWHIDIQPFLFQHLEWYRENMVAHADDAH